MYSILGHPLFFRHVFIPVYRSHRFYCYQFRWQHLSGVFPRQCSLLFTLVTIHWNVFLCTYFLLKALGHLFDCPVMHLESIFTLALNLVMHKSFPKINTGIWACLFLVFRVDPSIVCGSKLPFIEGEGCGTPLSRPLAAHNDPAYIRLCASHWPQSHSTLQPTHIVHLSHSPPQRSPTTLEFLPRQIYFLISSIAPFGFSGKLTGDSLAGFWTFSCTLFAASFWERVFGDGTDVWTGTRTDLAAFSTPDWAFTSPHRQFLLQINFRSIKQLSVQLFSLFDKPFYLSAVICQLFIYSLCTQTFRTKPYLCRSDSYPPYGFLQLLHVILSGYCSAVYSDWAQVTFIASDLSVSQFTCWMLLCALVSLSVFCGIPILWVPRYFG